MGVKTPVAKIWFENMDATPDALLGKLNLRVHADFKQMHLMAAVRRWYTGRYRHDERFISGYGVQLCIWLRCMKFGSSGAQGLSSINP
jgi:hypothetical protein